MPDSFPLSPEQLITLDGVTEQWFPPRHHVHHDGIALERGDHLVDFTRPPAKAKAKAPGKLRSLSRAGLLSLPTIEYLVDDLIPAGGLCVSYGAPKCGKTFHAMYMAYAIAQGRKVFGKDVKKSPVVYIAAEGKGGFRDRYAAMDETFGPTDDFHAVLETVDMFNPHAGVDLVIDMVRDVGASLVVLDTLARVMVGGDENSTRDMAQFVANCTRVMQETGAAVLVIHHSGWGGERLKGSINLLGAADMVWKVTATEGGCVRAVVEYHKEGAAGGAMVCALDDLRVGTRPNGQPRTTKVIRELGFYGEDGADDGKAANTRPKLTEKDRGWWDTITGCFAEPGNTISVSPVPGMNPVPAVTRETLKRHFQSRRLMSVPLSSTDRTKLARIVDGLQNKGYLAIAGDYVWIP